MILKILFFLVCFSLSATPPSKTVYFYPLFWGDHLFGGEGPPIYYNQDATRQLYTVAKNEGFELHVGNSYITPPKHTDVQYLISFDRSLPEYFLFQYPKEKLILFLWEPQATMPQNYDPEYHSHFGKIYTTLDTLVDNRKYFKIHYPVLYPMIEDTVPFDQKRLSVMVASYGHSHAPNALYDERRRLAHFFEKNHQEDFDLFGSTHWNHFNYKIYKGMIAGGPQEKIEVIKHYRFAFAYENSKDTPGYITEKIFACFQAGVVPIYYGAPNITSYIPNNCFIAREDFSSDEDLYLFLKTMGKEEYEEYLSCIKAFLLSDEAKKFSVDFFIETMMTLMNTPPDKESVKTIPNRSFLPIEAFNAKIIPIPITPENPFFATNPSIKKTASGYDINYRLINYDHKDGMDYWPREGSIFINRNLLVSTDKNFNLLSENELLDKSNYKRFTYPPVRGQEDCRLFDFQNEDWLICSITDGNCFHTCQMAIGQIEKDRKSVTQLTPLINPNPLKKEKNWLPFVYDNAIHAIYTYEPLTIYKIDKEKGSYKIAFQTDSKFDCSRFSGSAGPIPFDDGYLVLVHELIITDKRNYLHRFLHLNKNFEITKISPLFYFKSKGIEFPCGMTWNHEETEVIVSFGKEDKEAYLAIFPKESIQKHLSIK